MNNTLYGFESELSDICLLGYNKYLTIN